MSPKQNEDFERAEFGCYMQTAAKDYNDTEAPNINHNMVDLFEKGWSDYEW